MRGISYGASLIEIQLEQFLNSSVIEPLDPRHLFVSKKNSLVEHLG